MEKPRRRFTDAVKRGAVDDYISSRKSVAQVAAAHGLSVGQVCNWKVQLEEKAKGVAIDEIEVAGRSREDVKLIADPMRERDAYQKMVGEEAMIEWWPKAHRQVSCIP